MDTLQIVTVVIFFVGIIISYIASIRKKYSDLGKFFLGNDIV